MACAAPCPDVLVCYQYVPRFGNGYIERFGANRRTRFGGTHARVCSPTPNHMPAAAKPSEAAPSRARTSPARPRPPRQGGRDGPTTTQLALNFDPGTIKVRLTIFKDVLAVLRLRYMDHIFRTASALLLLNLCSIAWRSRLSIPQPDGLMQVPIADACAMLRDEFGWFAPACLAVMAVAFLLRRSKAVYLVDFSVFEPPKNWRATQKQLLSILKNTGVQEDSFSEEDLEFMTKVIGNSGTGETTAWPPGIRRCIDKNLRQDQTMATTRAEAETVICGCMADVFEKTGVQPKEVDFLIINCSLFSPTPSLCAMACNHFGMRTNVRTYNLSGQGCSASLLSVDLAAELLQNNPGCNAVVVSLEVLTQSLYHGHEKGFLLQNVLFRVGGAAVLLTSKPTLVSKAKYRLRHLVRTQCSDDESYGAVFQCDDRDGNSGVRLSKEIVKVAGNAMKINLTQLGPLVLPLSEQLKVVHSLIRHKMGGSAPRYVPSFKSAIHFFCIHAGGRAVLDGIEKNLRLTEEDMQPSRTVLSDKGNTSSSSIWYELRHIEQHMRLRRGHKILQLAFGSGFKCNSAVWTRIK